MLSTHFRRIRTSAQKKKKIVAQLRRVRRSFSAHGTTRLSLDGFSLNLVFVYFRKCVGKIQVSFKSNYNNGTLHEDRHTFVIISRSDLLRKRNVSDKSCTQTLNTLTYIFCVLHIQSNTTIFHLVVQCECVWVRRGGVQGFVGETEGKETTGETQAQMGG